MGFFLLKVIRPLYFTSAEKAQRLFENYFQFFYAAKASLGHGGCDMWLWCVLDSCFYRIKHSMQAIGEYCE